MVYLYHKKKLTQVNQYFKTSPSATATLSPLAGGIKTGALSCVNNAQAICFPILEQLEFFFYKAQGNYALLQGPGQCILKSGTPNKGFKSLSGALLLINNELSSLTSLAQLFKTGENLLNRSGGKIDEKANAVSNFTDRGKTLLNTRRSSLIHLQCMPNSSLLFLKRELSTNSVNYSRDTNKYMKGLHTLS